MIESLGPSLELFQRGFWLIPSQASSAKDVLVVFWVGVVRIKGFVLRLEKAESCDLGKISNTQIRIASDFNHTGLNHIERLFQDVWHVVGLCQFMLHVLKGQCIEATTTGGGTLELGNILYPLISPS